MPQRERDTEGGIETGNSDKALHAVHTQTNTQLVTF